MRIEELRGLLKERPFRPFTVYTTVGTPLPVWQPDFALLSPDGRTLWLYQRDLSLDVLDVLLIPRFSYPAPPPESEGESKSGAA
jgi:hypothetical protein